MAVPNSILSDIKKTCGLLDDYTIFDRDIILYINSVFMTLTDLGVGPSSGFSIQDDTAVWDDFVPNDNRINAVKTLVGLKVRMLFDPPQNSFAIGAMEKQIEEHEWRINVRQEATDYVSPGESSWQIEGMGNAIKIQAGIDWWVAFTYKDDEGNPIVVTDVKMEFRSGDERRQRVLFTSEGSDPSLDVDYTHSPLIKVSLPGSVTANMDDTEAWFDAYATDPDGYRVQLSGQRFVYIHRNVSTL